MIGETIDLCKDFSDKALTSARHSARGKTRAGWKSSSRRYSRLKIVNRRVQRDVFTQGDGADDIGATDNANDLIFPHHREPFNLMRRHKLSDLFDGGLFADANDRLAHNRLNVFALLTDDIGFGNDADDLTVLS